MFESVSMPKTRFSRVLTRSTKSRAASGTSWSANWRIVAIQSPNRLAQERRLNLDGAPEPGPKTISDT